MDKQMATTGLDIEAPEQLQTYLVEAGLIAAREPVVITRLAGGVSSRTMLIERRGGERWVIKQALPALRVHVEWLSSPERSAREAEGARALASILPAGSIPRVVYEDRQHHLFVMTAADATAENWKSLLLDGRIEIEHFRRTGDLLARVHRESAARCAGFAARFSDTSYFESLRLEPYYEYSAREAPEAVEFLVALCQRTRSRKLSLVHGDFSPKNLLVDADRMVLLDHEVIHFGDPAFDLGFVFAHFLSKAHHLPAHRKQLIEGAAEFWRTYMDGAHWSDSIAPHAAAHTLGCLLARVAGRSQLEYLTIEEKQRQRAACIRLVQAPSDSMNDLTDRFIGEVA
jgi:aminoglycoside phosphotransferase (APT) family kinase protein